MPEDLVSQLSYIRQTVEAFGILSLAHDDLEADDLIASAAHLMAEIGHETVIVSGDKDLLQLVSPLVTMWDPMKDVEMDVAAVEKKYGVSPDHLLDYFALTGDSSDNIPGVPGIGPKSAQKLISEFKNLEQLYATADSLKKSKALISLLTHKNEAFLSRDLVRLNITAQVPKELEAYRWPGLDAEKLRKLWSELEFHSLVKELPNAMDAVESAGFLLVSTEKSLQELMARLSKEAFLAIDTETDGLNPLNAQLVGVSLAVESGEAWYLPCGHVDEEGNLLAGQLNRQVLFTALKPLLANSTITKVGHNLKFDLAIFAKQPTILQNHLVEVRGDQAIHQQHQQ